MQKGSNMHLGCAALLLLCMWTTLCGGSCGRGGARASLDTPLEVEQVWPLAGSVIYSRFVDIL